ncbi:hypothetical protein MMC14_009985 [Varicellaria rhodocarpa]|nr:hypothetical protein [Varicellaria rhodocarpa]
MARHGVAQELEGLAEWQQPKAGMFIWLKILAGVQDVDDIAAELVEANVMLLPGHASAQDMHCTSSLPIWRVCWPASIGYNAPTCLSECCVLHMMLLMCLTTSNQHTFARLLGFRCARANVHSSQTVTPD